MVRSFERNIAKSKPIFEYVLEYNTGRFNFSQLSPVPPPPPCSVHTRFRTVPVLFRIHISHTRINRNIRPSTIRSREVHPICLYIVEILCTHKLTGPRRLLILDPVNQRIKQRIFRGVLGRKIARLACRACDPCYIDPVISL